MATLRAIPGAARAGARLGRGLRGDRDRRPGAGRPRRAGGGARRDRAALLGRHRRHHGAGQDRDRVRQAAGHLPADPRELVRRHGRPAHAGPVGHRQPDQPAAGGARHPDGASARRDRRRAAGGRVRAQHRPPHRSARSRREHQPGRRHPVGRPARTAARRPTSTTWSPPDEIDAAVRTLAEQVVADIRAEGRACVRVHLKVRFAPFFTFTRSRKLPGATYDAAVIADTALELLARPRRRARDPPARRTRRDGAARGWVRRTADPRAARQPVSGRPIGS